MRLFLVLSLACLSACNAFGSKTRPLPEPTEIIVTGAPVDSLIYIDGVQVGQATGSDHQSQVLRVAPGTHKIEVHVGDPVVYREETYVSAGDKRVVTVLSGLNR